MALKLITAATDLVVTLAEVKSNSRVTSSVEDDLFLQLIKEATAAAEHLTGKALLAQTFELTLDSFPTAFELTRMPVQSISSILYADSAGVSTLLSASRYTLDTADGDGYAYIVPSYGNDWPATRDEINAVRVRYVAGFDNAAAVPAGIKRWITAMVGALFENRELTSDKPNYQFEFMDRLLDANRMWK